MAHYTSLQAYDPNDADPNNVIHTAPPLHQAAYFDHADIALQLLKEGADPNQREQENNQTPLHWAAYMNAYATARILLTHGANPGARSLLGFLPLHAAALGAAVEVGHLLLEHDVRLRPRLVRARTNAGDSPLQLAALIGGHAMIRLLLEFGADTNELATPDQLSDEQLLHEPLQRWPGIEPFL